MKHKVLAGFLTLSAIAAAPAALVQTTLVQTTLAQTTLAPTAPGYAAPDYAAIVAAPDRSEADRKLDTNRAPAQWLAFIGAKPGMKILDIFAVYGWKAELLARRRAGRAGLCAEFGRRLCPRQGPARNAAQDPGSRQYRPAGAGLRGSRASGNA